MRRVNDRFGRDFGLKIAEPVRFARQAAFYPNRIAACSLRQIDHRNSHATFVVHNSQRSESTKPGSRVWPRIRD